MKYVSVKVKRAILDQESELKMKCRNCQINAKHTQVTPKQILQIAGILFL